MAQNPPQLVMNVVQPASSSRPTPNFELYNLDRAKVDAIMGELRRVCTVIGTLLGAFGWFNSQDWEVGVSVGIVLLTSAWSIWEKLRVAGPVVQIGAQIPPGVAVDPVTSAPLATPKLCPNCKAPQEPGAKFCNNCGTKQPEDQPKV